MNRQHYTDLNKRPYDWQDTVVMTAGGIAGAIWLLWIVEGLLK